MRKKIHDFFWTVTVVLAVLFLWSGSSKKFKRINWDAVLAVTLLTALVTVIYSLLTHREILKDLFIGVCVILVIDVIVIFRILRKR